MTQQGLTLALHGTGNNHTLSHKVEVANAADLQAILICRLSYWHYTLTYHHHILSSKSPIFAPVALCFYHRKVFNLEVRQKKGHILLTEVQMQPPDRQQRRRAGSPPLLGSSAIPYPEPNLEIASHSTYRTNIYMIAR